MLNGIFHRGRDNFSRLYIYVYMNTCVGTRDNLLTWEHSLSFFAFRGLFLEMTDLTRIRFTNEVYEASLHTIIEQLKRNDVSNTCVYSGEHA